MAEAFAKSYSNKNTLIKSAGDSNHKIHPFARSVMDEIGIKIPKEVETTIDKAKSEIFDVIVTLCNNALEICPVFPGSPAKIHWALIDPSKKEAQDSTDSIEIFREIRNIIYQRVACLFQPGFLDSIRDQRYTLGSILDNLTDGVMAHDVHRRIYYFNRAAERITGYSYSEVIGQDCHEIFPGRFCGGDCSFCQNESLEKQKLRYSKSLKHKNGEVRNLQMSVVTTQDPSGNIMGALVIFQDYTEVVNLRKRLDRSLGFQGIIGNHPSMQKVFEAIRELADLNVPILIQGESGTGKEMVAKALHRLSSRSTNPIVPVNCGALPEGTLESELFGHVKGAFTGAIRDKKGRFELADTGTIFLDEIGEITPATQVKMLRTLQDKTFVPVGGEKSIKVDVRIICATNKDLKQHTQNGYFREDLYYRLAVVPINLPPLRERSSDIPLLIKHFLEKFSDTTNKSAPGITPEALDVMKSYHWPGNIRELSNAVQYALIKCHSGEIGLRHLPPELTGRISDQNRKSVGRKPKLNLKIVKEMLNRVDGNKAKAARMLGVSRTTLYRFLSVTDR